MKRSIGVVCILALSTIASTGCGKKDATAATGRVQAAMANLTAPTQAATFAKGFLRGLPSLLSIDGTATAPTEFKIRLQMIYLVEDQPDATEESGWIGNNSGHAIMIWSAPDCAGAKQGDESGCTDMAYFDLNQDSTAVNAALNSQKVDAAVGTYRYVKLAMLGSLQTGNNTYLNTKWAHSGVGTGTQEFAAMKTEWGAKFDTPIVLAEGDTVTVTLSYDLSSVVYTGSQADEKIPGAGNYQPGAADDCAGTSKPRTCVEFPALTVSATKE